MSQNDNERNRRDENEANTPEETPTPQIQPVVATLQAGTKLVDHPFAEFFPLIEGEAFEDLKKNIDQNGLIEPIILHEGKILDGRNRYRALAASKKPILTIEWNGECGTPLGYVLAKNLQRRQLTSGQCSVLALDILPTLAAEAKKRQQAHGGTSPGKGKNTSGKNSASEPSGEAREQAAKLVGSNARYIQDAAKLQKDFPDLLEKVRKNELTLPAAMKEAKGTSQASPSSNGTSRSPSRKVGIHHATRAMDNCFESVAKLLDPSNQTKLEKELKKLDDAKKQQLVQDVDSLAESLHKFHDLLEPPVEEAA
jgi:ParB-like chromosome segregation protein Spo0J